MRVLTSRFAKANGEEGATAVIVVLCIIALFGMIVLVMDVGGLLFRRRSMVNGADAAALAAAKTCSLMSDTQIPESVADTWATSNVSGVQTGPTNIVDSQNCDMGNTAPSGWVSVRYQSPQDLFFAPVLGYPDTGTVTTEATAIWGPPGGGSPIPLAIYTNSFISDCDIETVPVGTECYFWFDNSGFGTSRFGLLDLRVWNGTAQSGWDAPANTQSCAQGIGAQTFADWITGDQLLEVELNYPSPTYVCIQEGSPESQVWDALESREGEILTFPINRCDTVPPGASGGQVDRNGVEVACPGGPHKYDIIGFVDLQLELVAQSQAEWNPTEETCGPFTRAFPNSSPMNLDTVGVFQGCFSAPPDAIDGFSVSVSRNGGPASERGIRGPDGSSCVGTNFDYCYDPTTRTVLWNNAGPALENQNYDVEFDWLNDGPCGPPAPNSSAACIVVRTVDVRIGGTDPGGGAPISNIRALKLCEPEVASTCAPVPVRVP